MIVVADTTPLNYLVLIDQVDLLPRLFGGILIPPAVQVPISRIQGSITWILENGKRLP